MLLALVEEVTRGTVRVVLRRWQLSEGEPQRRTRGEVDKVSVGRGRMEISSASSRAPVLYDDGR